MSNCTYLSRNCIYPSLCCRNHLYTPTTQSFIHTRLSIGNLGKADLAVAIPIPRNIFSRFIKEFRLERVYQMILVVMYAELEPPGICQYPGLCKSPILILVN